MDLLSISQAGIHDGMNRLDAAAGAIAAATTPSAQAYLAAATTAGASPGATSVPGAGNPSLAEGMVGLLLARIQVGANTASMRVAANAYREIAKLGT